VNAAKLSCKSGQTKLPFALFSAITPHPAEQRAPLECRPTIGPGMSSFKAGRFLELLP
jgi:hypothetical protein